MQWWWYITGSEVIDKMLTVAMPTCLGLMFVVALLSTLLRELFPDSSEHWTERIFFPGLASKIGAISFGILRGIWHITWHIERWDQIIFVRDFIVGTIMWTMIGAFIGFILGWLIEKVVVSAIRGLLGKED